MIWDKTLDRPVHYLAEGLEKNSGIKNPYTCNQLQRHVVTIAEIYCDTGSENALLALQMVKHDLLMNDLATQEKEIIYTNINKSLPDTVLPKVLQSMPLIGESVQKRRGHQVREMFSSNHLTQAEAEAPRTGALDNMEVTFNQNIKPAMQELAHATKFKGKF